MRSRNHRSWVITTAHPGNSSSAFSREPQRLDVQVVRRLVEQQQVAALLEREREVEAVALTAGEHPGLLLLVGTLEAELRDVGARRDLDLADRDDVEAVGDDLPQRLGRVDVRARLVDVADLDGLADLELAAVERLEADDRLEQRGLADAVRADDADDAVRRKAEAQPVDERASVEALLELLRLDDDAAEARPRRDLRSRRSRACACGRPRPPSPRSARDATWTSPGAPSRWSGPTRARRRGAWRASTSFLPWTSRRSPFFSR